MEGTWVLQIRRQGWQPRDLEFVLRVGTGGSGTATLDPVFIGRTTAALSDLGTDGDHVWFTLHSRVDDEVYRFDGRREAGTLDGLVRWDDDKREQVEPFVGFRRDVRRFDGAAERFPVERDPGAVGVEPVLLDRLVLGAETARSDGLVVLADGKLIAGRTFGGPDAPERVGALSAAVGALAGVPNLARSPSALAAVGEALLDGTWTGSPVLTDAELARLSAGVASLAPDTASSPWTQRPDPVDASREPIGFGALTSGGEGLLVYPAANLVVVRTVSRRSTPYDRRYDDRDQMEWLDQMADAIAVEKLGLDQAP
jgi:hypothetical protein